MFVWIVEFFPYVPIVNYVVVSSAVQIVAPQLLFLSTEDTIATATEFCKVDSRDPNSDPYASSWDLSN